MHDRSTIFASVALCASLTACGGSGVSAALPAPVQRSTPSPTPSPIVLYSVPTPVSFPAGIVNGADGNVWFVEGLSSKIARIDIGSGAITEYPLPGCALRPEYFARGSDDRFWSSVLCGRGVNAWAVVSTSGVGQVIEPPGSLGAFHEVLGPDGNIWYTVTSPDHIANITPAGVETYYSLATSQRPAHGPSGIAVGPDGDLWVAEVSEPYIDRVSIAGIIVNEYTVPTLTDGITAGPDGNMWFTAFANDEIGYITPAGQTTLYPLVDQ